MDNMIHDNILAEEGLREIKESGINQEELELSRERFKKQLEENKDKFLYFVSWAILDYDNKIETMDNGLFFTESPVVKIEDLFLLDHVINQQIEHEDKVLKIMSYHLLEQ